MQDQKLEPYPGLPQKIHIHPTAPLAERVLLPGDPGRALRLAQTLLESPKMFNHNRGLWGYTGRVKADGEPLSIQTTGMGGPTTAIVVSELIDLGARRLLRIGSCGGLDPALQLGDLLIATEAISDDGTSRALGTTDRIAASPGILEKLLGAGPAGPAATEAGAIVSTDLFYDADDRHDDWRARGARAVEMEAATLFTLARRRDVEAGCVTLVSDTLTGTPVRIDPDALHAAEIRLGELAVRGLSA